jgi:TetR/AcrR family transcriptional regulator of autoinduction and epiphytic fitness
MERNRLDATVAGRPTDEASAGARPAKIDGRVLRGQRTRQRIVESTLELLRAGDPAPGTAAIARGAGVSVRALFQHFTDVETLHAAVAEQIVAEVRTLVRPIDPGLPFDERLDRFVAMRTNASELLLPLRISIQRLERVSPGIAAKHREGRDLMRQMVAVLFATEISRAGSGRTEQTVATLMAIGNWMTWAHLRTNEGLSVEAAREIVRRGMNDILIHDVE